MNRFIYRAVIVIIVCVGSYALSAQERVVDTVRMLQPVKVEAAGRPGPASNRRFAAGTHARIFSVEHMQSFKDQNLSDYLQQNSAVYMKEFGQGMGAYISIRGTSASHTSIHWNGMGVEMPTMGQTDFSHLPLFFFDAMTLHIGGGSALYGNGSIGGSIQLDTRPDWRPGLHGQLRLSAGSFDHYVGGASLRYGGNRWESRSSALYTTAQNRFSFTNNTRMGKPRDRQQHAAYQNYGFLQEMYKKVGSRDELSLHVWYMDFDREIQPSVSNNDRPETWSSIYDRNLKVSAAYKGNRGNVGYSTQAGYAWDDERYKQDVVAAHRMTGSAQGAYGRNRFMAKAGGSITYVHPVGKSFDAEVQEWRTDVFGLLLWKPAPSLAANLGVRQSFVSHLPLSPNPFMGAQWSFLQGPVGHISLRGAFSQSHKIPTLNDRYWGGNNVYLRPERATTWESGLDCEAGTGRWRWALNGTVYGGKVIDWIRWFPAGVVWRPQNIPLVNTSGIEASFRLRALFDRMSLMLNGHYAYTDVTVKKSLWERDPGLGRQLAYQPYHCLSAFVSGNYMFLSLEIQSRYTGARTTNDLHDLLPGYWLWNLRLAGTGHWGGQTITLQFMLNNVFNQDYQNVKFYAMPGRHAAINLHYQF